MKTNSPIQSFSMKSLMQLLCGAAGALCLTAPAHAQSTSWNLAGNGAWGVDGNWSGGAPVVGGTAVLPGTTARTITITGSTAAISELQALQAVNWTISGGTLVFGAGGKITAASNGNNPSLTISSAISAAGDLTVTGARIDISSSGNVIGGSLNLGASTRLLLRYATSAGSANINLNGNSSQLQLGAGTFTNDIRVNGNSTSFQAFNITGQTLEIGGNISEQGGKRAVSFSALNDGGTIVISGSNSYTGDTTIGRSTATANTTIRITSSAAFGSSATAANVGFQDSATQTLEMSGGITVANRKLTLSGSGVSNNGSLRSVAGNNTWNGEIDLGTKADTRIGVNTGSSLTIDGAVTGSASGGLNKVGEGALILKNAGSYSTGTQVLEGLLLVENTSGSGTGTGAVSVSAGAGIGGDGNIAGNLTLDSGAWFSFSLEKTLSVEGNVSFGGFSINNVHVEDWSLVANNTYTLIDGAGNFDYTYVDFDRTLDLGDGRTARLLEGGLQLQVIPEPGVAGLLVLGGGLWFLGRRRKHASPNA